MFDDDFRAPRHGEPVPERVTARVPPWVAPVEPPATTGPAPSARPSELDHEALRRLRVRLIRKYH
jgi:hypothetical protein